MLHSNQPVNKPEFKVGPFAGGVGVEVWLNEVSTAAGPRQIRSIRISPRRYCDGRNRQPASAST